MLDEGSRRRLDVIGVILLFAAPAVLVLAVTAAIFIGTSQSFVARRGRASAREPRLDRAARARGRGDGCRHPCRARGDPARARRRWARYPFGYDVGMDVGSTLRTARRRAGLSQGALAARARNFAGDHLRVRERRQAALRGDLQPAARRHGARLEVRADARRAATVPSPAQLARAGRTLVRCSGSPRRCRCATSRRCASRASRRASVTLPERLVALHRALARRRVPMRSAARSRSPTGRSSPAARATSTSTCSSPPPMPRGRCARCPTEVPSRRAPRRRSRATARSGCGGTTRRSTCSSTMCPVHARAPHAPPHGAVRGHAHPGAGAGGARGLQGDVRPHARLGRHRGDARRGARSTSTPSARPCGRCSTDDDPRFAGSTRRSAGHFRRRYLQPHAWSSPSRRRSRSTPRGSSGRRSRRSRLRSRDHAIGRRPRSRSGER